MDNRLKPWQYKKSDVPSTYKRLNYIQSSGSQYINTSINSSNKIKMVVSCAYTANTDGSGHGMFDTATNGRLHSGPQGNNTNIHMGIGNNNSSVNVGDVFDKHTYGLDAINKTFSVDGVVQWTSATTVGRSRALYLFKINTSTSQYYNAYAKCKMYFCKIWDNGTLKRDFVPVMRKGDSKYGMYDKVSKTFFGNNGSGNFTGG